MLVEVPLRADAESYIHAESPWVRLVCLRRDDEIVGVGFAWDNSDELKLKDSFGIGRTDLFTHFVDVRLQAELLGYHGGLSSLAKLLLGFDGTGQSSAVRLSCKTCVECRHLFISALACTRPAIQLGMLNVVCLAL